MTNSYDVDHGLSQDAPGPLEPVELAAVVPAARTVAGWKPIESAPKDGTSILARGPQQDTVVIAWNAWALPEAEWRAVGLEAHGFECPRVVMRGEPTLWQPLPADPCPTCNDQGAVGNILTAQPCPACAAPASPVSTVEQGEARDWELSCDHCNGSGFVFVERQVAERKTDVQEFKEECECCEGRGFTIAFQDIPGIEAYVKSFRPAIAKDAIPVREKYEYALARLGLKDSPSLRVIFWDALDALEWDSKTDRYIAPQPIDSASAQDDAKDGWSIDTSAGRPILVRNNCSVIEAEDAEYVLRLIAADRNKTPTFAESIFGERIGGMLDGSAPAAGDAQGTVTLVTRPGRAQELFTYSSQPCDNVIAWRIGEACGNASRASAGDYIDRGLGLLKELQAKGYGIAALAASQQQEG